VGVVLPEHREGAAAEDRKTAAENG
jgi:hypothetical protein